MVEASPSLLFTQEDLVCLAHQILDLEPDPAPRCLVSREILHCSPTDAALQQAEKDLTESRWVLELAAAQQPDGTWGRFHTQDTRVKSPFPTTEFAIRRALALGLTRHSPILQKAAGFIAAHLAGQTTWSDPPEKHDDPRVFATNIRTVSAAMLALIDRHHPLLDPLWLRWSEIVAAAFAGGSYDPEAELARHQALTGVPSRRLYAFHPYYPLIILSSTRCRLDPQLEGRMLAYLLHKPGGIYYVCDQSLATLPHLAERGFLSWLHGQEILARFAGWKTFAPEILNWLWSQRNESGLWDVGKGAGHSYDLPLSESWRRAGSRAIDCSVKILCLLQQYYR